MMIRNCIFSNNNVTNPVNGDGAGLYVNDAAKLVVCESIFNNNTSTTPGSSGGGLRAVSLPTVWSFNVTFNNNSARTRGGGLDVQDATDFLAINNVFFSNSTNSYAGACA